MFHGVLCRSSSYHGDASVSSSRLDDSVLTYTWVKSRKTILEKRNLEPAPHGSRRYSLKCRSSRNESPTLSHRATGKSDCVHGLLRTGSVDVTTLGNLCVDIVLNVPSLPPPSLQEKFAYMEKLAKLSPDENCWEAGGNCNFAIAAARLGLQCVALGHVGDEKYGRFLHRILEQEGVQISGIEADSGFCKEQVDDVLETLICWVLVDPKHQHGFCSHFDFNKEPAFNWMDKLPARAEAVIRQSKVLFCNGFVFDELSPAVIASALDFANISGCAVFFDPGPRAKALVRGTFEEQQTLWKLLSSSTVLLLTVDEAEALSGLADPIMAAQTFLGRGRRTDWVIIKMGEKGCLMATTQGLYNVPAFKVNVADTVGCGDSFAAAVVLGYIHGLPITSTLVLANAVGGATAMGCGAGRNVATVDKVTKLLQSLELCDTHAENCGSQALPKEKAGGITLVGNDLKVQSDCSSLYVPIHAVAKEALNLLEKSVERRTNLRI